jgi:hypothetical protein
MIDYSNQKPLNFENWVGIKPAYIRWATPPKVLKQSRKESIKYSNLILEALTLEPDMKIKLSKTDSVDLRRSIEQ